MSEKLTKAEERAYMKAGGCPLPALAEPKPKKNRFLKFTTYELRLMQCGLWSADLSKDLKEALETLQAKENYPRTYTFIKILVGKQYQFVIQAPSKNAVVTFYPNLKGTVLQVTKNPELTHAAACEPLKLFYRPQSILQDNKNRPNKGFAPVGLDIAGSIR